MSGSRLALVSVFFLALGHAASMPAMALQADSPAPASRNVKAATPTAGYAAEEEPGDNEFRHSAAVKMMGGWMHLDKEAAARTFEYVNFAVLAGAVLFGLLKILPKTFRKNRADIQHQLIEARTATQQANERLAAIEQRLSRLGEEVDAISKQAEKDSVEDEARIRASMDAERERIVTAATKDIAAAGSAAQRDLKHFAAGLAIDRATQKIALTDAQDRSLVQEFVQEFGQTFTHGQQQKRGGN